MDKDSAKRLVKKTLQSSFNKEQFIHLIKNTLNEFEERAFTYKGNTIPKAFQESIKTLERVGQYKDSEDNILDILIVQLKKESALERARSKQRNFISWYLKSRGDILKDGALVAFVSPNQEDWRFSFVQMEYKFDEKKKKIKEEWTPARRYSFLVGENENSHTAQSCLLPLLQDDKTKPTIKDLGNAFSVEAVTKEFYEKYRLLFEKLTKELETLLETDKKIGKDFKHKKIKASDFSKKLLGQIVFLYFLQKKGWFGVKRGAEWGTGSKKFLRELFEKKYGNYNNFFNNILEPLFYEALQGERAEDYYSRFDCRIPFLNGGLFEPIGNYDWVNTDILLPDSLFSNQEKTKEGDVGNGILDIFDRYNFTVKEDEPLEKEVAVDPEMLGKVFENLLEIKDRKSKGAYYTPREIVHYMCQESLINYLFSAIPANPVIPASTVIPANPVIPAKAGISKQDIETLVRHGESAIESEKQTASQGKETKTYSYKISETIRTQAKLIDEKLKNIRICDPAVGSGAFPVGMMNEIVKVRNVLTSYLKNKKERTAYYFKRQAIEQSLYGVDIDSGAIEIAKLRLWLSLVVDEEEREKIQPLPNLDYKMVCGNSLLSVEKDLFNQKKLNELEKLKPLYFNETSSSKKQKYKKQIDQLISEVTKAHKTFDFEIYFSEVFHEKNGFDVVIANPPYVSHDKIKYKKQLEKYYIYESFSDVYCYFYEKAVSIQNNTGVLCYITSNSYLKSEYGKSLRDLLSQKQEILTVINIENYQVFDTAIVNTTLLISQYKNQKNKPKCLVVNEEYNNDITFNNFISENKFFCLQEQFIDKAWYLLKPRLSSIKKKIEKAGKLLKIYKTKIRLGIATGANNIFIIDEKIKSELIKKDQNNVNIIKPILRGRDIFRYKYQFKNQYIILAKNGINIEKEYPTIYHYFDSFGDSFKNRGAKGEYWFNLRPTAFLDDFKKEKIIWIELTNNNRFALCEKEIYLLNSAYFLIPPKNLSAKYLLSILNSKIIKFYLNIIAETSGMGVTRWINTHVSVFPIPEITLSAQNKFINLVDKILSITKSEDYLKNASKQKQVSEYEKQIDQLVYKLYGLTPQEIKIIENSVRRDNLKNKDVLYG